MCPPLQLPKVREIQSTEEVVQSLNGSTTLMLCDIHLSLGGPRGVLQLLRAQGLLPSVDYLYLPRGYSRKSKRRCNGSISAFVNFTSADMAAHAVRVFHGMTIQDRRVYVCRAKAQGVPENLMHFRTVRTDQDVLETAWPYVVRDGALRETAPAEVAALLGIEQEVNELRRKLDACGSEASSEQTASTPTSTPVAAPLAPFATPFAPAFPACLPPMPMPVPDISQVSPELIAAYMHLLAASKPMPPTQKAAPETWWSGKLEWSQ
jgi:hypothetical protein